MKATQQMRASLRRAVASALAASALHIGAALAGDAYPEQALDVSLKEFAVRTRVQVVYMADLTKGRLAPEVPSGLSV